MSLLMSFFVSPNGIYVVIVSLQVVFPSYLKKKNQNPKTKNKKPNNSNKKNPKQKEIPIEVENNFSVNFIC